MTQVLQLLVQRECVEVHIALHCLEPVCCHECSFHGVRWVGRVIQGGKILKSLRRGAAVVSRFLPRCSSSRARKFGLVRSAAQRSTRLTASSSSSESAFEMSIIA